MMVMVLLIRRHGIEVEEIVMDIYGEGFGKASG